jgi:DNA-3-methyladenine glycosylase
MNPDVISARTFPGGFAPLPREFYLPSAEVVAPELLGHLLIRNTPDGPCGGVIVETEAYLHDDPACHAFGGETARNRSMYGSPGHAYVYLIYGVHFCFNTVCRPAGFAEAVLIRAIEVVFGESRMRERRPVRSVQQLSNGPGKLCAALDIDRGLDGVDLCAAASPLIVARNPERERWLKAIGPAITTRRIGITKAAELSLRFLLEGSRFVS